MKLFDFTKGENGSGWAVINDNVMGGLSASRLEILKEGVALFSGTVSLANGGGFASVKSLPGRFDLSGYSGMRLRVKGDGRRYSFRIRTTIDTDRAAYEAAFDTGKNEWMEVDLPFDSFRAVFRGKVLTDEPPLDRKEIVQFGFMIKERQEGPFRLEIEFVGVYEA